MIKPFSVLKRILFFTNEYPKEIQDYYGKTIHEGDSVFIFRKNRHIHKEHGIVYKIIPDNESINICVILDGNQTINIDYPYTNYSFIKEFN